MVFGTRARYTRFLVIVAVFTLVLYTYRDRISEGSFYSLQGFNSNAAIGPDGHFDWSKLPIRHPVSSLHPVPTGEPLRLPKVQHTFPQESPKDKQVREQRRDAVRDAFVRGWESYKKHAWMADELAPISGRSKDHFGGWAATLVDALDTLWIMDLKDEFAEAVAAAVSIDFSGTTMEEINVFETTIRYLGGFLSAYDLSGDERLLIKAKELGEMLLVAFDTPNRMPVTRWRVNDARKRYAQEAHEVSLLAEIGSLTMEFTRLSQITNDSRWYDATYRIMEVFEAQQGQTRLPGMWPILVNAKSMNFTWHGSFALGAMADSLYEYLPKMHALLGGLEPMYEKLYHDAMAASIQYTIFRPMTPDSADILIAGTANVNEDMTGGLDFSGQHLVCFAGGMFGLGGKLFKDDKHLDIARRLTDGCIWTYRALPLGIMPEVFSITECPTNAPCAWNETYWKERVLNRKGRKATQGGATADMVIETDRLPKAFTAIGDRRYVLRPEAIESVFVMYRITGREDLLASAWDMFNAIQENTKTDLANGALADITRKDGKVTVVDSMESFWLAETLKYFYLVFSEPEVISLDDYVLNTEAHPFKVPKPRVG
ncbi:hypothetical protein AAFC00_001294 [Neodothiora populina]|uniref:alpha-1,2-Mannosidase n=1 Tax=Neodothiora populina TaxID=2781224 RepID=A0ABR3PNE7_9PEZI